MRVMVETAKSAVLRFPANVPLLKGQWPERVKRVEQGLCKSAQIKIAP